MKPSDPERHTFLVRVWCEPQEVAGQAAVRECLVQVEYLPSREKRYFMSLEEAVAYLRERELGKEELKGG